MPFEQTVDLLAKLENVHGQLSNCYGKFENTNKEGKVKLLLQYLKDHEIKLKNAIQEYGLAADAKTLRSYYQQSPEKEKWEYFAACSINDDTDFDNLIKTVLESDEAYIGILEEIYNSSKTDQQKDLFGNLLESARQNRKQFVFNIMTMTHG